MILISRFLPMILSFLIIGSGCVTYDLTPIPVQEGAMAQFADEMEYFEYLKDKPRCSTADAARLVSMLLDEKATFSENAELKLVLLEHGIVKEEWEISEAAPLTKGRLAFMLCYAADIKTSMVMIFSEPSERYAIREAVYHELIEPSNRYGYVSGKELMDALSNTENYLKRRDDN